MKIAIFFFSSSGNTWRIAKQISDTFKLEGAQANIYNIETIPADELLKALHKNDILGFGYPIFGSDLPFRMKQFLVDLPALPIPKPVFVFCTQWLFSGDGTSVAQEFLPSSYSPVKWSEHFFMPNNICISSIRLPYTNDQQKIARKIQKTQTRINPLVHAILKNKTKKRGFSLISTWLGRMQRKPFRKYFEHYRNRIGIDFDRCISCNLCVEVCPMENFSKNPIQTKGTCMYCLRCYNFSMFTT
ncbi:MAG: EFR1 family ferrodoxin [Sphaerochaeta sp.]|nr:EFR1 family ferrodoxin [Sphaerochaeta sp.]